MSIKKKLNQAGPPTRSRASHRQYLDYQEVTGGDGCAFCSIPIKQSETIIETNKYTWVVENRFSYSVWDGCAVVEHLMVIPKAHRGSLVDFTKQELAEWIKVCTEYESKGYSIYTRAQNNTTRSVFHHHTHFIRLDKKRKRYILYSRKPHILLTS